MLRDALRPVNAGTSAVYAGIAPVCGPIGTLRQVSGTVSSRMRKVCGRLLPLCGMNRSLEDCIETVCGDLSLLCRMTRSLNLTMRPNDRWLLPQGGTDGDGRHLPLQVSRYKLLCEGAWMRRP